MFLESVNADTIFCHCVLLAEHTEQHCLQQKCSISLFPGCMSLSSLLLPGSHWILQLLYLQRIDTDKRLNGREEFQWSDTIQYLVTLFVTWLLCWQIQIKMHFFC